jgi:hypothetical protein
MHGLLNHLSAIPKKLSLSISIYTDANLDDIQAIQNDQHPGTPVDDPSGVPRRRREAGQQRARWIVDVDRRRRLILITVEARIRVPQDVDTDDTIVVAQRGAMPPGERGTGGQIAEGRQPCGHA